MSEASSARHIQQPSVLLTDERVATDCLHPTVGLQYKPLQQLLIAVDFSNASLAAARLGLSLVQGTGTNLRLLHVVETTGCSPKVGPANGREAMLDWWNDGRTRLKELARWLRQHHENVTTQIRIGLPAEQILEEAAEASLLLLGRRCPRRFSSWFSKRTAKSILERSACPVLLVNATESDPGFSHFTSREQLETAD